MKIDKFEVFSDGQSGAGTDTTVVSTNVLDLGPGRDMSLAAENMWLNVTVGNAATGGASVQVVLQASDVENFGSGVVEFPVTGDVPVASLTAGARVARARLPLGLKRYVRVAYKNVGPVAGVTWNSFLTYGVQAEDNYTPSAWVV